MADGGIPPTLIQARGRWASGIFHIYTHDTIEQQATIPGGRRHP